MNLLYIVQRLCLHFAKVVTAIHHLHDYNVVHADIKPSNLLLSDKGIVKVVDFDISFELHTPILTTPLSRESGTRQYMAPELFPASKKDYRRLYEKDKDIPDDGRKLSFGFGIDIWAIGITLLDVLFGENVFAAVETFIDYKLYYKWKKKNYGRSSTGIMDDIFEKYISESLIEYPRPEKIAAIVQKNPELVDFLFQKCLVIDQNQRATANELCSSSYVTDMLSPPAEEITLEAVMNSESAETLRKMIKNAQLDVNQSPS